MDLIHSAIEVGDWIVRNQVNPMDLIQSAIEVGDWIVRNQENPSGLDSKCN